MTASKTLDATLVNAFMESAQSVYSKMLSTEIQLKEVKAEKEFSGTGDISALIGITGPDGEGMAGISFPFELANQLVAKLMYREAHMIDQATRQDGVAEILNMVAGAAKSILSEKFDATYKLSVPSVISGKSHSLSGVKGAPFLIMIFSTEGTEFQIYISFKKED